MNAEYFFAFCHRSTPDFAVIERQMATNKISSTHTMAKTSHLEPKDALVWADGQLSFISHDCKKIPESLSCSYGGVTRRLDLSFNSLRNLNGLENFIHLEELILDNNQLDDSTIFKRNPFLHTLSLNKNKIADLELLLNKIKSSFPNLRYLSLLGNVACPNQLSSADKDDEDYQRYRYFVLYKMPALKFLDFSPVKKREIEEASRVGQYMKVVKPADNDLFRDTELPRELRSAYSPLPQSTSTTGHHTGAYAKCRYHYSGKHSEGNRFIRNSDL